jgi:hypothetical protein
MRLAVLGFTQAKHASWAAKPASVRASTQTSRKGRTKQATSFQQADAHGEGAAWSVGADVPVLVFVVNIDYFMRFVQTLRR